MSAAPARTAPPPPPPEEHDDGASANERLLGAAKSDNEAMLEEAMGELENVNFVDGLGNTALHYAIQHASTSVLEPLLENDTCDVDLRNRLAGDTPLHIAVRQRWEEYPGMRRYLVSTLLDAGADTTHNQKPIDLLPPNPDPNDEDFEIRAALRKAEAEAMVADKGDVVDGAWLVAQLGSMDPRLQSAALIAEDEDVFDPNDIASDSD